MSGLNHYLRHDPCTAVGNRSARLLHDLQRLSCRRAAPLSATSMPQAVAITLTKSRCKYASAAHARGDRSCPDRSRDVARTAADIDGSPFDGWISATMPARVAPLCRIACRSLAHDSAGSPLDSVDAKTELFRHRGYSAAVPAFGRADADFASSARGRAERVSLKVYRQATAHAACRLWWRKGLSRMGRVTAPRIARRGTFSPGRAAHA